MTGRVMRFAALAIFAFSIPSTEAQPFVYVLNQGSGLTCYSRCVDPSLIFVNLATRHTLATIPLGSRTVGLPKAVLSPDASRIYAAASHSSGGRALLEISTATHQIVGTVNLSSEPLGIDIAPDGSFVVVLTHAGIVKIDTVTRTVAASAAISEGRGLTVSPDGSRVYSVDGGGTVTAVDFYEVSAVSPTGFGPAGGDVSIDVPAPAGCSWSIASSNPDILFTSFTSGTGPAVVTARVPAGGTPLAASLTIAGSASTLSGRFLLPSSISPVRG